MTLAAQACPHLWRLKVQYVVLGRKCKDLHLNANQQTIFFSWPNNLNKQTDLKGQHLIDMWRTLPPLQLQCFLGTSFSSESSLSLRLWQAFIKMYIDLINIVKIKIPSLNLFAKKTHSAALIMQNKSVKKKSEQKSSIFFLIFAFLCDRKCG